MYTSPKAQRTRASNKVLTATVVSVAVVVAFVGTVSFVAKSVNHMYHYGTETDASRRLHNHGNSSGTPVVSPNRRCNNVVFGDPPDGAGWTVIFHLFGICYSILFIHKICGDSFVEAVHKFVEVLEIPDTAAGATIMAAGSSMPELMAGAVGYAFKETEAVGVGTILGSLIFNSLVIVAASVWVSPGQKIGIDPFVLLRDASFYAISVLAVLICFGVGVTSWFGSLCLILIYAVYVLINLKWTALEFRLRVALPRIGDLSPESVKAKAAQKQLSDFDDSADVNLNDEEDGRLKGQGGPAGPDGGATAASPNAVQIAEGNGPVALGDSSKNSRAAAILKVALYPIDLCVAYVPQFQNGPIYKGHQWLCAQTFVCLFWLSFAVFWMIEFATMTGCILGISPSLMGLTVTAIGTSLPDAMASIMVAQNGHGAMSISNMFGSNIFDTLIALGVPWLFASLANGTVNLRAPAEELGSIVILIFVFLLYLVDLVYINKMELTRRSAIMYFGLYFVFILYCIILDVSVAH
jgi:K+-dependent Na+/Ca+ exchanger-like protein